MHGWTIRLGWVAGVVWWIGVVWGAGPILEIDWDEARGRPVFSSTELSNRVVELQTSLDGRTWLEHSRTFDRFVEYPEYQAQSAPWRWYRLEVLERNPEHDWKNQVRAVDDPLLSPESPEWAPESRWIKFALLLGEPHRVWFQDSTRYSFHYDFARARLPGFEDLTREEFDALSLRTNGQRVVLGALLFPPQPGVPELGIQFAGQDAFAREDVVEWFGRVRDVVVRDPVVEAFYLPAFEQAGRARAEASWLEARGVRVSSADRWIATDQNYAPGWALGRLVMVPGTEVRAAYRDGRLGPLDILLTDAVPAEIPPVAGVVTLSPATPNSHVAILAADWGIPFVYLADEAAREALRGLAGEEVLLRVVTHVVGSEAVVSVLSHPLDAQLREEILRLRERPELQLTPKARAGVFHRAADALRPGDIGVVGGKAANFGLLRMAIPEASPSPALAFTFDLWEAYMDRELPGRGALRSAIEERLGGFVWPPDVASLEVALAEVRDWITDEVEFGSMLEGVVLDALVGAGFDQERKIRFRSSTNVEDSEVFTGAGLYDSYSGCLGDDLDGDSGGPSWCEPEEERERGVFRALRRVYASFYNDNAYLERLRHRVDEQAVGMAVLVHYSTPDPLELANGVATLDVWRSGASRSVEAMMVTQDGAVSVANPETGARPERVRMSSYSSHPELVERSSLVQLGATVLDWPKDYQTLFGLLDAAAQGYETIFPNATSVRLDFEYKKVRPGDLRVKQIRRMPLGDAFASVPAYLLGTGEPLAVEQGESGDVFGFHRLKSVWNIRARHTRLDAVGVQESLVLDAGVEMRLGTERWEWDGPLWELPESGWQRTAEGTVDRWALGVGEGRRRFELQIGTPSTRAAYQGPLARLTDLPVMLRVEYAVPQPSLGWGPRFTNVVEEGVWLTRMPLVSANSLVQERSFANGVLKVRTRFYWPPAPTGIVAGYTAPLQAWIGTEIEGLTSRVLELRGDWSQTYHPGHHNFTEEFLFDPWLEAGVDGELLDELAAANIRGVVLTTDGAVAVWGLDDSLREW